MLNGKIKGFFTISGGNSGLTEGFIYNNQPVDEEDAATVYSSSTIDTTSLKRISKSTKIVNGARMSNLKVFTGEGILIARNGKAGTMKYLKDESIVMNDHAYFLQVKNDYTEKIDLHFLLVYLRGIIKQCVSSDGEGKNGTFNKTLFEQKIINLPDINEQLNVKNEVCKIEMMKNVIIDNINKIDASLNKRLVIDKTKSFKLDELFLINQGHQITDEEIYNSLGSIPIYTSSNKIKGYGNNSLVSEKDLPCITYPTKGFSGTISIQTQLFDANNTATLILKNEYRGSVSLKYVSIQLEKRFLEVLTSKSGVSYLNKEIVSLQEIYFPTLNDETIDTDKQDMVVEAYEKIIKIKERLEDMYGRIITLI